MRSSDEYLYAARYDRLVARHDSLAMHKLAEAYVEYMTKVMARCERQSRALFGRDSYHADVGVEQGAQRARVDVRRIIRLEAHGREAILRREYRRAESERRESCQRSVGTAREGHAKARAST